MAARQKTDVFKTVNHEHAKDGGGQGFPKVLHIFWCRTFGRKNKKRQKTREHGPEDTHPYGNDLLL